MNANDIFTPNCIVKPFLPGYATDGIAVLFLLSSHSWDTSVAATPV